MPLESLLELVETLRVRIDTHGSALRQSEALTRYALIDPLLRELGWDTSDPDMVVPEYRSGAGSADYALLSSGSPAMMVEAKKLGTPLQGVLTQGIGYCITEGIEYFSVTDGQRWEVYETHKPVPIDEKRIASWDLKDTSLGEVCLKVLALWRPSVQSGYVTAGEAPVIGSTTANLRAVTGQPLTGETPVVGSAPSQLTTETTVTTSSSPDENEWLPLTTVHAGRGTQPPIEVLLPDNSHSSLKSWVDIPVAIVSWLLEKGILDASHYPIPRARRYLLATSPFQPDGRSMTHKKIGSLFMGTNYSAVDQIKNACIIIEHVGKDPAEFKVRFS